MRRLVSLLWVLVFVPMCMSVIGCDQEQEPQPAIGLSATSHDFGPDETEWSFDIWNAGDPGSTLDWEVSADKTWISLSRNAGASTATNDRATVNVMIDRRELDKATHSGSIIISAPPASSRTIGLTVSIGGEGEGEVWYVDNLNASGTEDGTGWETAFTAIQDGINAATDGDIVLVAEGTYVENIHVDGKDIVLRSTDPANPQVVAATVIDGNQSGSVVSFAGTETEACVLSGFTITNGSAFEVYGGGICGGAWGVARTYATIRNNTITGNAVDWGDGGGLYGCHGTIENNTISDNLAYGGGGGGLYGCDGTIQNNTITGNSSEWGGGLDSCLGTIQNNTITGNSAEYGGALYGCHGTIDSNVITGNTVDWGDGGGMCGCDGTIQNNMIYGNSACFGGALNSCHGAIRNNTITANSAEYGGGLDSCDASIQNCILWGNTAFEGAQLRGGSPPEYSCIQDWNGGGPGNITLDPQLAGTQNGDLHLQATSPCIDAGRLVQDLPEDFEGHTRGFDGSAEARGDGSDYDIGADEFVGTAIE